MRITKKKNANLFYTWDTTLIKQLEGIILGSYNPHCSNFKASRLISPWAVALSYLFGLDSCLFPHQTIFPTWGLRAFQWAAIQWNQPPIQEGCMFCLGTRQHGFTHRSSPPLTYLGHYHSHRPPWAPSNPTLILAVARWVVRTLSLHTL